MAQLIDLISISHRSQIVEFFPFALIYSCNYTEIDFSRLSEAGKLWALNKGYCPPIKWDLSDHSYDTDGIFLESRWHVACQIAKSLGYSIGGNPWRNAQKFFDQE